MDSGSIRPDNQENISDEQSSKPQSLPLQHLREITDNFSNERVLGTGAFGVVYKGVKQNGQMVAVKKLLYSLPRFQEQFENEVHLLMRLEHPNIVRLVGYCYETQNKHMSYEGKGIFAGETESLLCLEYLAKGSLDRYLSDPDESSQLDWHARYKIIEGICYGLQYLHEKFNEPIIHLDLKPANILLDENMMPKITDFGLSRLFDQKETICTMNVGGTPGYMPPEFLQGIITPMSDIFSLGVIILEVITGHRDYPDFSRSSCKDFIEHVRSCEDFIEHELQKWRKKMEMAPSIEVDCEQIKRCIQIGLICLNPQRSERPTTKKIIKMLHRLESTDYHIIDEIKSLTTEIRSGPRELLDIYPLELYFSLEPDKRIRCLVKLTNKMDKCIAFHFKVTKATNNYCIEPTGGFLFQRAMIYVVVTMEDRGELPLDLQCNDEFLVQSIIVREDRVTAKHIPEDTFNKMSIDKVHKVKLLAINGPPAQSSSDIEQSEGSRGQSRGRPEISPNRRSQQEKGEQLSTQPRSLTERELKENQDALIKCLANNLGYCAGKPIAAITIYKCLVQWRSFQAERTSIFDSLVQLIVSATEVDDMLVYWLSNLSTLLILLQRTLKSSGAGILIPVRRRRSSSTSSFGRMTVGLRASAQSTVVNGDLQRIEAKYPALRFKQQLTAYHEKIYCMIRDNLKKELAPLLYLCIHAQRTLSASLIKGSPSQANASWNCIVEPLANHLSILKSNYIPSFLIRKVFTQIFSFINMELFNGLLLERGCCSFSNGEYVKAGLAKLEQWCIDATADYAGSSWEELRHIRQAVMFLVIHEKSKKTMVEITNDLCPALSIRQLYRISSMYWDDKYGTKSVSSEVISAMRKTVMEDPNKAVINSFTLDLDLSIPFSVDDIVMSVAELELTNVDMPPSLQDNPSFNFLHERQH